MKTKNVKRLIFAILICQLAGLVGSLFTYESIPNWYASLKMPSLNPPNWIFGPVWITLYTLMGVSLYLVWTKGLNKKNVRRAIMIFSIQLALNSIWSILFFGLKLPFYALIEIVVLWFAIAFTIFEFYKISEKSGLILLPYIVWVTFALFLNYNIWVLNP